MAPYLPGSPFSIIALKPARTAVTINTNTKSDLTKRDIIINTFAVRSMANYSLKSIFAPLPVTTRGQNFHLQTDPKNEKLLYCSGPAVVVRDLANPAVCYTYTEHSGAPTAACFAPSGFYICSGDTHGKVRIWDTTQETHIIKYEGHGLSGPIRDICWSPDSKRVILGGAGRNSRTHCFLWDSGSSCGSLHGHSKDVNAVAHSPTRPFRAVTVSEDFHIGFHTGVPYKFVKTITTHKNFVNCVRYSPTGANFCTASSDKRVLLFDGKTGDELGEMKDESGLAHKGGVMALSYNTAGTQLLTASADKTVRLWDIETGNCVSTMEMGTEIIDQQLGCLWAGEYALSVSFSGDIKYLDLKSNSVTKVLRGHQKSIETMEVKNGKIYTSSFEGRSSIYDVESGDVEYFTGATHKSKILDTKISGDTLVSVDLNNKILRTPLSSCEMGGDSSSVPSNVTFFDVHSGSGIEVYCCDKALILFKDGSEVFSKDLSFAPNGCTISPCGTVLAVGAKEDPKLYLYDIEGNSIVQRQEIALSAAATEIKFSPNGKFLGAATVGRAILLLDVEKSYKPVQHCWSTSSKSISCSFSPDSSYLAVAGIDTNIVVGNTSKPMEPSIKILRAHPLGTITRVRWLDENTIASTGSDMQVRQHTISV